MKENIIRTYNLIASFVFLNNKPVTIKKSNNSKIITYRPDKFGNSELSSNYYN